MKYRAPITVPVLNYPLVYKPSVSIVAVKHGVTEIELSNGKLMLLTIHVDGVEARTAEQVDVSYSVVVEMMDKPEGAISDVHETVQ